jgi:hypothetical protein
MSSSMLFFTPLWSAISSFWWMIGTAEMNLNSWAKQLLKLNGEQRWTGCLNWRASANLSRAVFILGQLAVSEFRTGKENNRSASSGEAHGWPQKDIGNRLVSARTLQGRVQRGRWLGRIKNDSDLECKTLHLSKLQSLSLAKLYQTSDVCVVWQLASGLVLISSDLRRHILLGDVRNALLWPKFDALPSILCNKLGGILVLVSSNSQY